MNLRNFALIFGIVFILVGALGLAHIGVQPYTGPALSVASGEGDLLGLFHVNVLHNIVHLLFGVLGLAAFASGAQLSRLYAQLVGVAYLLLVVLGAVPVAILQSTFGLIPIGGHDVWLHALLGLVGAYFGFIYPATPDTIGRTDMSTPTM